MKTYVDAYNGDDSIPVFVAFAIEQYKNNKGISGEEAARILDENGILDHLAEYYDVLHTQSAQWLVKEMDDIIAGKNHETDLIPQR